MKSIDKHLIFQTFKGLTVPSKPLPLALAALSLHTNAKAKRAPILAANDLAGTPMTEALAVNGYVPHV